MTPWSEGASFLFYPSFARQFGNQMGRNEVAKLVENSESAIGWLVPFVFFHTLPCGKAQTTSQPFFSLNPFPVGQQWFETAVGLWFGGYKPPLLVCFGWDAALRRPQTTIDLLMHIRRTAQRAVPTMSLNSPVCTLRTRGIRD